MVLNHWVFFHSYVYYNLRLWWYSSVTIWYKDLMYFDLMSMVYDLYIEVNSTDKLTVLDFDHYFNLICMHTLVHWTMTIPIQEYNKCYICVWCLWAFYFVIRLGNFSFEFYSEFRMFVILICMHIWLRFETLCI